MVEPCKVVVNNALLKEYKQIGKLTDICGPRYTTGTPQIASIRRKSRKKYILATKYTASFSIIIRKNQISQMLHISQLQKKIEYVIEANLCWTAIKEVE